MYPTDSHPEKGSSVEGLSLLRSVKEVHLSLSRNADVVGVGGINADDGTIGGVVDAGGGGVACIGAVFNDVKGAERVGKVLRECGEARR